MSHYDFTRLNKRSFEQLIQAFGTVIAGSRWVAFSDGPEGIREAAFDGTFSYDRLEQTWNGRGLAHVRFHEQLDSDPKKNIDWIVKQLKEEFARLAPRRRKAQGAVQRVRECPDYYILATNVSLSPRRRGGRKDRVRALLDGYKESHGLKDYALWDADQIGRFLDGHTSVWSSFAAWVEPGDVIEKVAEALKLDKSFASTMRRYLESELLDDQLARLGEGGYTDAKNIPLSSVFVDLPLEKRGDTGDKAPTFLSTFFAEGGQSLRPSVLEQRGTRLPKHAPGYGRLVLIGGPGQGKTTLSQFACQLLRASLLRDTEGPVAPEVSQALERLDQMSADLPPIAARRYPLRVDLKQFAAVLAAPGGAAASLFDYLRQRIANRTNTTIQTSEFWRWLSAYAWVLILDGLDEVPASSNRTELMKAIRDFTVNCHAQDADLLVLATTRPQGYSDEFDPAFYTHISLAPLEPEDALLYGERLATARHPGQRSHVEKLITSLTKATQNPATARLMQSPLQVTIMLALIEGGGQPPEQRWKLFRDYYDVIYRREKERDTSFSDILRRYEPDVHWVHHRAGWLLQQRNAAAGATDARFTHKEFERLVDERLLKSGHEDEEKRRELVETIRLAATNRLVLLVGNTAQEIGFEVRSFQEFMAAEHIFDGGEACVQKTLHLIGPYGYWRNVFLFAAGRIFFEREWLIDTVVAVCMDMNDGPDDRAQRTTLSGSRLALALLTDGVARNRPASVRVLARVAARCLDCHDREAILAIRATCSGEAEEIWKEELSRRLGSSDAGLPHDRWLLCLLLAGAGKEWAKDLMTAFFPWRDPRVYQYVSGISTEYENAVPDEFRSNLLEHATSLPLQLFSDLFRARYRERLPEPLATKGLQLNLERVFGKGDDDWPIEWGRKGTLGVLAPRATNALANWAAWQPTGADPKTAHPEWLVSDAVSEFARMPTLANLSAQLAKIARLDGPLEYQWFWPWQINLCALAREEGRPWTEIQAAVENGDLGSPADWTRWNTENQRGMSLARCRQTGWKVSDECQGAIIAISGWTRSGGTPVDPFVSEFTRALQTWSDIGNVDRLVAMCWSLVYDAAAANPASIVELIETCTRLAVPLTTRGVVVMFGLDIPTDEKARLLAKVGSGRIQQDWLSNWPKRRSDVSLALAAMLHQRRNAEEWYQILHAVSYLRPIEGLDRVPEELLKGMRAASDDLRHAALKIKINSVTWRGGESADLGRVALELHGKYWRYLEDLAEFIESTDRRGSHIESFLVELLSLDSPEFERPTRSLMASLLVKLVERRPAVSELPDPQPAPFQVPTARRDTV